MGKTQHSMVEAMGTDDALKGKHYLALTNMLAVKTLDDISRTPASTISRFFSKRSKMRDAAGQTLDTIPPLKATFVGPCVGVVPASTKTLYWSRDSRYSDRYDYDDYWRVVQRSYARAETKGRPPPFMIDIV